MKAKRGFKYSFFSGILLLTLLNCAPIMALDNVLVSREDSTYNPNSFIKREAYETDNVLVSREDPILNIGDFVVRKDKYRAGAALVSRLAELDVTMLDMLKANGINSLEDYADWLRRNVEYKKDEHGDNWALPEETLERKYGDCEDFAFFNASVLRVLGYQPNVLALGTFRILAGRLITSHAICAFRKGDHYLWFDNEKLKQTRASSMEEFAEYIFANYAYSSISELIFDNKEWVTLFKRSDAI